ARGLAFSADGRTLRAVGEAGIARWDARAGSIVPMAEEHRGDANAIATAPDGTSYAVGMPDGEVRVFDAGSDRMIGSYRVHAGAAMAASYSPDSRLIASGGRDGIVCLWDVPGRRVLGAFAAPGGPVAAVRFSPDGRTLAVAAGSTSEGEASSPGI